MTDVAKPSEAKIAAAYLLDRAEQYSNSSSCKVALENAADKLRKGEHLAAYEHGELDDILERLR